MQTAETKNKYTVKDYMLLEEGAPFQLINYDLIHTPSRSILHQTIMIKIVMIVGSFEERSNDKGLWIMGPINVILDEGNVFQPDWVYVLENRKAEIVKDRVEGSPDLIIEILSPETAQYDLGKKKDMYEKYGVREYIIIYPIEQIVEVHVLKEDIFVLNQKTKQPGTFHSTVLNGFSVDLKELFEQ